MIPLRLSVKNFMCYRDDVPTLDLEGIHVACLCGDNGHGKTALLDAITWALWGTARTRIQEELVHQGQQDMAVELEFSARGQRYRVSRRHSRGARSRQGTTILELQAASDDGFRPITGNIVRDTEARIREILHMDYETFINTAFLRQGDADRFTTSKPAERKGTLAEVLDLSYYQALEERAKSRSRAFQEEILRVQSAIASRQEEISNRPEYETGLASAQEELARIVPEAEAQQRNAEKLRRQVEALRRQRSDLEDLASRSTIARQDVGHLEKQVASHRARIDSHQADVGRQAEILEGFASLEESRAELVRLDKAHVRWTELQKETADLQRAIAVQQERFSQQAGQVRTRIKTDLEPRANRMPQIEEGLRAIQTDQATLEKLEQTLLEGREEALTVSARVRYLEESNAGLKRAMEETRAKFDMLERGDNHCPLCKEPLGPDGQQHLRIEYESQGLQTKGQYQENSSEQRKLEGEQSEQTVRVSRLEADVKRRRQKIETGLARAEQDRDDSERAQSELRQAVAELKKLESRIGIGDFAVEERKALATMSAEVSALDYDADEHRQQRERVRSLESYEELRRRLREAEDALPAERQALERAGQMLGRRRLEVSDAEQRLAAAEEELKGLPPLELELQDVERLHENLDRARGEAQVRAGILQQQVDRCIQLESEVGDQERERHRLVEERSIYDELATAFGKNGIQALIIETAIPNLEADANQLLARLTENRMSLKLQLLEGRKDSRSGLPSEELDIKVADDVGTRSYETFSGGEAFRINFALRIALSKLLARRSGAPLPILFIDEGFGSQDTTGQERLTEAIQSIQDDFEKIIVITHVDQIKESFPIRIEVTKTGAGSSFQVV